jgi:2-polyprenyl-6-methoxyphenol hydroxylase-like FAD-dependent oxidoreductase
MTDAMLHTRCCIVGGGPAGLMVGFLLARAGVEVLVLEKHADFLRDFRGDTIHPSTLEVMHELGFLDAFLALPHEKVRQLGFRFGDTNRGDYWQCGYVIAKGTIDAIHRAGLLAFRESVASLAPLARDRVGELRDWDDIKLLTVRVDRLLRGYRPGLLCIGDAAHAIQTRRELPTRITQRMQVFLQDRLISRVLEGRAPSRPPLALRLLARFPVLRRIPARLIGLGVRPEHVRLPEPSV